MKLRNKPRSPQPVTGIVFAAICVTALIVFCLSFGYSLLIPVLLVFMGIYLHYFKKATFKNFSNLGLLLFLVLLMTHAFRQHAIDSYVFMPTASVVMLTMLLFNDLQLTFGMAFLSVAVLGMILGINFETMLIFFMGSLSGAYFVRDARRRGQLISAGLLVGLVQTACLLLSIRDWSLLFNNAFLTTHASPLFLNGLLSALFVMAALKIFEFLFGEVTNFSLLELSDFNHPLLKRMILEAPGSYQHSLVVGNLAEAAADAIGAHALLTRVGAYYHDIGKILKPEYYNENQLMGGNVHDNIEPSISRLVVLNHVKEGVELAKKYKLNQRIIDFIPQHHGTSIMHYFYQKSLEGDDSGKSMAEESFRYPGPKPQSRETAIVLLADSVEGATRALDDPSPVTIEETVKRVVNNKFIDGQLDECNLTLKEIDKISATFIRLLSAMYHSRVKYPEKKNGQSRSPKAGATPGFPDNVQDKERSHFPNGDSHHESAEENPSQSSPD